MSIYSILSRDVGEFKISAAWPTHREDERARQRPRLYIIQSFGAGQHIASISSQDCSNSLMLPKSTLLRSRHILLWPAGTRPQAISGQSDFSTLFHELVPGSTLLLPDIDALGGDRGSVHSHSNV